MTSEKLTRKTGTGHRNIDHVEKDKIPVHVEAQHSSTNAKHRAKDATVDTTKTASEHVGDAAVAARNTAVESGKGAAGYVGNVGAQVKDQAVVAGWGTAHYTMEKVAEATKVAAGVGSSVAGFTGDKAVAVKDTIEDVGQTVAGYAAEKLNAAKDEAVEAEETAAGYAARKKAEAQKDMEIKRLSREKEGGEEHITRKGQFETIDSQWGTSSEGFFNGEAQEQRQGGILHAIGETIMEIGQTTKQLLIGKYPIRVLERKDEDDDTEEPYLAARKGI